MPTPESIITLAGRVESFIVEHHLAKRRASSLKKRTGGNVVTWPHSFLAAEQLAQAGFYYKPSSDSLDNVVCFICDTYLDGWEPGDDPFVEHLRHSPNCGWAVNTNISHALAHGEEPREDPMGERLMQAREATFRNSWPHEARKGWKCKTKKMIEAGWCYDPSPEYDDGVRCFYCDLSLDGWEPKDDPFKEHRSRSANCRFFLLSEEFTGSRLVTKGKKGRSSRTSKVSRLSTQSNLTAFSEAPSLMSLGDVPVGQDDSVLSSTTGGIISAPKGRKTTKSTAKATRKASRTKKNANPPDAVFKELCSPVQIDEAPKPQDLPKRTMRRVASRTEASQVDVTVLDSQSSQTSKAKGKGRAKARMSEDESQLHLELQDAIDASIASSSTPKMERMMGRGTKRSSDGVPKLESSVVVLEDVPTTFQDEKPKVKRGRKPKQPVTETQHPQSATEISASEHNLKPISKVKKSKVVPKQTPSELEPTVPPKPSTNVRSPIPTPSAEPSPAPSTPTPAKPPPSTRNLHFTPAKPTKPIHSTTSPHSDAENQPPSSRPQPITRQVDRVPLAEAAGTPNGVAKQAAVRSAVAWTAADLEQVFCLEGPECGNEESEDRGSGTLKEIVERVRRGLSAEEKTMSVEGWLRWNAARCEEGLRARCEEMVTKFEREGARAMGVLEGIHCV